MCAQIYFYVEQRKEKEKREMLEREIFYLKQKLFVRSVEEENKGESPSPVKPIAPVSPPPSQQPVYTSPPEEGSLEQPSFQPNDQPVLPEKAAVTFDQPRFGPANQPTVGTDRQSAPPVAPAPVQPNQKEKAAAWWEKEWEVLVGGKLLNRIGAVALILGLGFFLKYAFDNNWISEPIRLLLGVLLGTFMLFLGAKTHKKGLTIFAQGAVGVGIAAMYLTAFAAHNFYGFVSPTVAVLWMSAVTALAFQQAIIYNSVATLWIAWFGGAWTPFLFPTEASSPFGFYLYFTLFTLAILLIIERKTEWKPVYFAHVPVSYLVFWEVINQFSTGVFSHTVGLLVVWGSYMIFEYRLRKDPRKWMMIFSYLHPIFLYTLTISLLSHLGSLWERGTEHAFANILVGFFFTLPLLYGKWQKTYDQIPVQRRTVFQSVFFFLITIAVPHLWSDPSTIASIWAVEAVILAMWGLRFSRPQIWYFSAGIWLLSVLVAFSQYSTQFTEKKSGLFFNENFLPIVLAIAGALFVIRIGKKAYSKALQGIHIAWITVMAIGLHLEWYRFIASTALQETSFAWLQSLSRYDHQSILTGCLLLLGVGLYKHAIRNEYTKVRSFMEAMFGLLFVILLLRAPFEWSYGYTIGLNIRTLTFVLIGLLLYRMKTLIPTDRSRRKDQLLHPLISSVILFLAFEWSTVEIVQYFDRFASKSYPAGTTTYLLVIAWAFLSFIALKIVHQSDWARHLAEGILFMSVVAFLFATLLGERLFPLFNLRTFSLVVVSMVLIWLGKSRSANRVSSYDKLLQQLSPFAIVCMVFEWISMEIIHYFSTGSSYKEDLRNYLLIIAWGLLNFVVTRIVQDRSLWTSRLAQGILCLSVGMLFWVALKSEAMMAIFNIRTLTFLIIAAVIAFQLKWRAAMANRGLHKIEQYTYASALILLLLEMTSVEVWTNTALFPSMQQLALSLAWLSFAVILLAIGIHRKWKKVRLASLALMGITIGKIFLLDLSFLDTIYRIVSFIVLGIILLATSYIYQRHKDWFV